MSQQSNSITASNRRIFVILPAAGSGSRMGSAGSKVLLRLGERSVLEWSLDALRTIKHLAAVIVPAPAEQLGEFQKLSCNLNAPLVFVPGGKTRQDSVRIGLGQISERFSPQPFDIVVVHDAARCFASPELFARCIAAASSNGAAVAALPVVDTLKTVTNGQISGSIDRSTAWAMQTPQVFTWELIQRAHESNETGATDDVSLVQRFAAVSVVEGERTNIKLTTPDDFELAKKLKRVE